MCAINQVDGPHLCCFRHSTLLGTRIKLQLEDTSVELSGKAFATYCATDYWIDYIYRSSAEKVPTCDGMGSLSFLDCLFCCAEYLIL